MQPANLHKFFSDAKLVMANFNFRLEDVLAEKDGKKAFTRLFCILASKESVSNLARVIMQ